MQVALLQPVYRRRPYRLRDQELRWVEQPAIVDAQLASKWRADPQAQTNRVGPDRLLVEALYITRRNGRGVKDLTCTTKHIAAVIERYASERLGQRYSQFQVRDSQRISAERDSERIEDDRGPIALVKYSCRNDNDPRPCLFEIKPPQVIGTARKEPFADGKQAVKRRKGRVVKTVSAREHLAHAENRTRRQGHIS